MSQKANKAATTLCILKIGAPPFLSRSRLIQLLPHSPEVTAVIRGIGDEPLVVHASRPRARPPAMPRRCIMTSVIVKVENLSIP